MRMSRRSSSPSADRTGAGHIALVQLASPQFATIASWFANPRDVAVWAGPSSIFPLDVAQFARMLDETAQRPPRRIARVGLSDGAVVGHAQAAIDWTLGTATLQRVAIAPGRRGQGLAVLLLRPFLDELFRFPELARIELLVFPFNEPAIRAYRALGFRHEGCLRSSMPFGAERWNTLLMALLKADWESGA